jgi:hypothetical protein
MAFSLPKAFTYFSGKFGSHHKKQVCAIHSLKNCMWKQHFAAIYCFLALCPEMNKVV